MYIDITKINDRKLKIFLELLKHHNIQDISVLGGAVRDMLLSIPSSDIDIAIHTNLKIPQTITRYNEKHCIIHSELKGPINELAKILYCKTDAFLGPVTYQTIPIDLLGLYTVQDGSQTLYPDIFIDSEKRIFGARPELTLNRIAINAEGKVWPASHVNDCLSRIGRFTEAILPLRLRQGLRAMYFTHLFKLELTPGTLLRLKDFLEKSVNDIDYLRKEMKNTETFNLAMCLFEKSDYSKNNSINKVIWDSFRNMMNHFYSSFKTD